MRELTALQKSLIADLAAQIEALDRAVDKLAAADKQYRDLAKLDYAPRTNGHLRKMEDSQ